MTIFEGCIYWPDINRVQIPNGRFLDHKRFNVWYGSLGVESPWVAFTRNHPPIKRGKPRAVDGLPLPK